MQSAGQSAASWDQVVGVRGTFAGDDDQQRDVERNGERRTLMAKNKVNPIEPKYAAVKGSRGPEIRCLP